MHHWRHPPNADCDPWSEPETPWHRGWKERFPEGCREVTLTASSGEKHRADVCRIGKGTASKGVAIEFQHSNISDEEKDAREAFYPAKGICIGSSTYTTVALSELSPFATRFDQNTKIKVKLIS